jgi:hypothetical protein
MNFDILVLYAQSCFWNYLIFIIATRLQKRLLFLEKKKYKKFGKKKCGEKIFYPPAEIRLIPIIDFHI